MGRLALMAMETRVFMRDVAQDLWPYSRTYGTNGTKCHNVDFLGHVRK